MFNRLKQQFQQGLSNVGSVFNRQLPTTLKGDEKLDITFRDFLREVPGSAGTVTRTIIPGISEAIRTTGQVYGEGLALALDRNVRTQVQKAREKGDQETLEYLLPTLSRTTWQDYTKKVGAGALEALVYKTIGPAMRLKLIPRGGVGALQGIGRAISEGVAKDETAQEITDRAKSYAKFGAVFNVVAPHLMKVLGSPIKEVPKGASDAAKGFARELKDAIPAGIRYKHPVAFETGLKEASLLGSERMKMADSALKKRLSKEFRSLTPPGSVSHATYSLPGANVKPTLVTKKAADGSTYKAVERRFNFSVADFTKQKIRDKHSMWQSPASMSLWQDNVPIMKGKFGSIAKNLYYPQQEALGNYSVFQRTYSQKAHNINKQFGLKIKDGETTGRIMELIPNKELKTSTAQSILKKYGDLKAFKGVTEKHVTAAKEYRTILDELRVSSNKMRKLMGLKEIGELDRYLPHLQKTGAWDKVLRADKYSEPDVARRARDFLQPTKVANRHAEHRVNELLKSEPEKNLFALYDRYVSAIGRDIYYNPAIKHMTTQTNELRKLGYGKTATFWEDQIRDGMISKVGHPFFEKLAQIRAMAAIPANNLWMITVQPSSMALTVKDQTWRDTTKGAMKYYTDKSVRKEIVELAAVKIKSARGTTTVLQGSTGMYDSMVYRPFSKKYTDLVGMPINAMERHLTGMSAAAGLEHGKKLGFTGQDLRIYASMAADMSQSMYNAGSRPLILNNPAFRFIFPFKTFVLESQAHALEMLGQAKAPLAGSTMNKVGYRLGQATSLATSVYLINKYNEKLRGVPAYTAGAFTLLAEPVEYAIEKVTGKKIGRFSSRSPLAPFEDFEKLIEAGGEAMDVARKLNIEGHSNMVDLGKAAAEYAVSGDMKTFRQQLLYWGMGLWGFAGAGQVNKTIDGIIAAEKEYVADRAGAEMFKVEGLDKPLSVLFGPWATKSAREYREEDEQIRNSILEQKEQKQDITSLARHYLKRIGQMEDEQEKRDFADGLIKDFPEVSQEMERIYDIEKKGLTSLDKKLLQLNVANSARAREIERILRGMGKEERIKTYMDLKEKRVISDEVEKQLERLFELNPL